MTFGSVRRILPHGADGESPEHLGAREERAMAEILGTGAYRYEVVNDWAKLPPGQEFNADVAAVGVDVQDRVYAFNRGRHPVVVLDREGNFLRSWGQASSTARTACTWLPTRRCGSPTTAITPCG